MDIFTKSLHARWGDMDFNGHMRNTAYLDASGDVRMMFFAEHGFPMKEFISRGLGPVIVRDELEYFRELRLLEPVVVSLVAAGMSEDMSSFRLVNAFAREDGKPVARVTSDGVWLDLGSRRVVAPPAELCAALGKIPRAEAFATLPSRVRAPEKA